MSVTPVHEELQDMLPAAALQILEPAELEQVLAHVRDCPECDTLLQEYRQAGAALSLGLPARHLDSERSRVVRTRLMARVRAGKSAALSSPRRATSLIYQWSGWMVAAGLGGVLLVHHSVHRPLDFGWLTASILVVVLLGLGVYAWVQRSRVAALEDRLAGSGSMKIQGDEGRPPGGRGSVPPGHDLTAA